MVLLGIEHLEQRRRRITPEVATQLVDLVEHEDGVARLDSLQALQDAARQGADVRSPVAADLGLVADATQRDPRELPVHGARDRAAQRRLARSRRANEAQDRALQVLLQLQHGDELEDPLLDLLEAVVVLVEDLAGRGYVEGVLGLRRPRQIRDPLEIGPDGPSLHRTRGLGHQVPQLTLGPLLYVLRHAGVLDPLAELFDLLLRAVVVAELAADGARLLAQDVLALVARELFLNLVPDLPLEVAHLLLARQVLRQRLEPSAHLRRLEQLLLLFDGQSEVGGDHVG